VLLAAPRGRKEEVATEANKSLNLTLVEQLISGPRNRATIKKVISEYALRGELSHHLGHENGEAKPAVARTVMASLFASASRSTAICWTLRLLATVKAGSIRRRAMCRTF